MENVQSTAINQLPIVLGFIHIPEKVISKCTSCKCDLSKYNISYFTYNVCRACEEELLYPTY